MERLLSHRQASVSHRRPASAAPQCQADHCRHTLPALQAQRQTLARACPSRRHEHATVASSATDSVKQSTSASADAGGREIYRPSTYSELVADASRSVATALDDGVKRMEVDFPPLTSEGLGTNFRGSDEFIDANVQLAISASNKLQKPAPQRVHILVPDKGEFQRSFRMFKGALERTDGQVTMGYLTENKKSLLSFGFGGQQPSISPSDSAKKADLFMAINMTSIDLPVLEKYVSEFIQDRPLITWNLELDTLRSDLGLPFFPPKDLQYRFLSSFKPVFYIRPRDYSKSISAPPFVVNYSGCLFREYPGPWQCMLRESDGQLVSVADRRERFVLGELKEELGMAIGLNTEAPGSTVFFLRRGFRTTTWWEDAREEETYGDWRT